MKKFINLGQFNRVSVIMIILGIGVGILVMTQWKTPLTRVANPVTPYVALRDTRDDLTREQNELKNQITTLQNQITDKQNELKKYKTAKNTVEEVETDKVKVGLTELKGKGIVIALADAEKKEASLDSISHAADLRDIINLLWQSGAEAINVNGQRIVFNTSIDCIVNTILINSTKTIPPFEIKAIGNQKVLAGQINNPNNLKDIKKRAKSEGLIFNTSEKNDLVIAAYQGSYNIEFAKIVK